MLRAILSQAGQVAFCIASPPLADLDVHFAAPATVPTAHAVPSGWARHAGRLNGKVTLRRVAYNFPYPYNGSLGTDLVFGIAIRSPERRVHPIARLEIVTAQASMAYVRVLDPEDAAAVRRCRDGR